MPRPGAATACRTSSAIGRVSGEAGAKRRGVGEGKGGESRRSRERGEGGGEWRRNGAKELAQRAKRKERERSAVEGGEADRVC